MFCERAGEIGSKHILHRPACVWDHPDPRCKQPSLQGPGNGAADEHVDADSDQIRGFQRRFHILKGFLPAIDLISRIDFNQQDCSGFIEERRNSAGKYRDRYLHAKIYTNKHAKEDIDTEDKYKTGSYRSYLE
jgi:hypothetical protein